MTLQAQVHGSCGKKPSEDDQMRKKSKVFRDDTAQAYENRGYLSRHSSEPEAQSLEPRRHMYAIDEKVVDVAGRAQHRSQSITSGKKDGRAIHGTILLFHSLICASRARPSDVVLHLSEPSKCLGSGCREI